MDASTACARAARRVGAATPCRLGVACAALLAFALSVLWAFTVPAFWGVDETSHVAYAVAVASGDWPTIDTPNPIDDFPGLLDRLSYDLRLGRPGRLSIWTSNHPPLYFLVAGIPLRLGLATGHAGVGLLATRLLTAAVAAAGVLAVGWLATAVAPRRPRVAVVAAMCAALSPTLVHYAGQIYNDTSAFTLSSTGLAAAFVALRYGSSRRLLVIGSLTAGAGALTRSSSLALGAFVATAFALAAWFDTSGEERSRRLRAFLVTGLGVGSAILLVSGWAVLVNVVRYGDPTAAGDLFDKFGRVEGPAWSYLMTRAAFAVDQVNRFAAELSTGVWWPSAVTHIVWAVLGGATVGAVRRGVARVHARRWPDARGWWLAALSLALPTVLIAASALFISRGGFPHSRYLLPGLAVMAVMAALGVEGLPGARRGWPALATLTALLVANIVLWMQFRAGHERWYQEVWPFPDLVHLAPDWLAVAVALLVGVPAVAGLVRSVVVLSSGEPRADGGPRPARDEPSAAAR